MKKLRIDIKPDRYRRYDLFNSVEALYIWLSEDTTLEKFIANNSDCIIPVELDEDGQWLEIEWMGCEFVRKNCMHYVRIARATPKHDGQGISLGIYAGWIHNDHLSFKDAEDDEIIVKRVDNEGKIDMEQVFKTSPKV
jgi:hypothetical protein